MERELLASDNVERKQPFLKEKVHTYKPLWSFRLHILQFNRNKR